jgi:hypothetical protein
VLNSQNPLELYPDLCLLPALPDGGHLEGLVFVDGAPRDPPATIVDLMDCQVSAIHRVPTDH